MFVVMQLKEPPPLCIEIMNRLLGLVNRLETCIPCVFYLVTFCIYIHTLHFWQSLRTFNIDN